VGRPGAGPQHLVSGRVGSGRPGRSRGLGGWGEWGVSSRGVDRRVQVNGRRLGQGEAQVRRLYSGAGRGAMTHQGVKLEVVVLRVREHNVWERGFGGDGHGGRDRDRDGWGIGLGRGLGVPSLVTEFVNLLPVHPVRDELLGVGHVSAHRALAALALDDPVAGAVVTGAPGAAGHHHRVAEQLLADGAQQLLGDSHLYGFHWFIIVQKPGILFYFLLTVRQLLHLVDHNQSLWIDLGSRNVGVSRFQEAAGDSCCPLHVIVGEGTVADPVVAQALVALPVRRRLGSLGQRSLALELGPVLLRVHLRGVAHHFGQFVLL